MVLQAAPCISALLASGGQSENRVAVFACKQGHAAAGGFTLGLDSSVSGSDLLWLRHTGCKQPLSPVGSEINRCHPRQAALVRH
jgi:hypothetical protein